MRIAKLMQGEPVYLEIVHAEPIDNCEHVQVLACLIDKNGNMISDLQYFLFDYLE